MASLFDSSSSRKIPPGKAGIQSTTTRGADTASVRGDTASVEVLVVGDTHIGAEFTEAFENSNWKLEIAFTPAEAVDRLRKRPKGVVICEQSAPGFSWRERVEGEVAGHQSSEIWADLLALTRKLANPPKVIVASRGADDRLWADVLHQGGYD